MRMPDWLKDITPPDWAKAVAPLFALSLVCYQVFAFVEDRLSTSAKQDITVWLKSVGDFSSRTLSLNLLQFHNILFGDSQFSTKCAVRTIFFSFVAVFIVFF